MFIWWISVIYLLCSIAVLLYNRSLKKKGFTGIPTIQCFNPLKWFSVVLGYVLGTLIPRHIFEQFALRVFDEDCRSVCLASPDGKCTTCGCPAYLKMMSPTEKDSRDNWGPIIFSKKKYLKFREEFPVSIKIEYGKIKSDEKIV